MLLDKSIVIHAPPERVFEWLSPARMPRWDHRLVRAAARPFGQPLMSGAHFDRVSRELGIRFAMDAEAVAVEPGRVFAWRQSRGDFARHQGAFLLEAVAGGTRVHLMADVELPYVLPRMMAEADIERALSREADDALFNLKRLVEQSASGAGS